MKFWQLIISKNLKFRVQISKLLYFFYWLCHLSCFTHVLPLQWKLHQIVLFLTLHFHSCKKKDAILCFHKQCLQVLTRQYNSCWLLMPDPLLRLPSNIEISTATKWLRLQQWHMILVSDMHKALWTHTCGCWLTCQ